MLNTNSNEQTYLKQILDNSPDGVFTISTELEIRYVNPAFCRILGFTAEELLGTPITTYLGDLKILDVCMAEVSAKGKCNDQETIFKRKDGSVVHISKNVQAVLNPDGSFSEILVTIRDLTNLHTLNRDLAESKEKLESYNQELESTLENLRNTQKKLVEAEKMASLGSLVAGVAHEINTPLGIGITSSSTLEEELKELKKNFTDGTLTRQYMEDFFEQSEQVCSLLYKNLNRASNLVKNFKQVAVDQAMDDLREINIKDYCDEILMSLRPQFKHTQISIENACDEDITLTTHPGALYQIFSNLLLNTLVHAYDEKKEGKITIQAQKIDDKVEINYRDDGKGIAKENLKQIFEPFYTTRRNEGGSGLGLSIVYNVVTGSLNGSIVATSDTNKGTQFKIVFPVTLHS